jgi:hypothetical protein
MSDRHRLQGHESEHPHLEIVPEPPAETLEADTEAHHPTTEPAGPQEPTGPRSSWLHSHPWWVLPLVVGNVLVVLAGCTITLMSLIPVGWYWVVAAVVGGALVISMLTLILTQQVTWPAWEQDQDV